MTDKPKTLGHYELLERLGMGRFAIVHRARDTRLKRIVALKLLKVFFDEEEATFRERFYREAQAAAGLQHPHIITVYDLGEAGDRPYIAMEYLAGPPLDRLLAEGGPLPWPQALAMLEQLASAVDYAHSEGLVHRDVKPGNVLTRPAAEGETPDAVLSDFGLVKIGEASSTLSAKGSSGGALGTPAYMAPELWEEGRATPAGDQYALACIAVEMLTGRVLFNGPTPAVCMKQHLLTAPPLPETWPAGVPEGATDVLLRGLAKAPAKRYPTCGTLVACLRACKAGEMRQAKLAEGEKRLRAKDWAGALTVAAELLAQDAGDAEAADLRTRAEAGLQQQMMEVEERRRAEESARQVAEEQAVEELAHRDQERKRVPTVMWGLAIFVVLAMLCSIATWILGQQKGAPPHTNREEATQVVEQEVTKEVIQVVKEEATKLVPATATLRPVTDTMVYVPAGEFTMGSNEGDSDEKPVHTVYLDAYWIDKTEVTNRQFAEFLNERGNQSEGSTTWLDVGDSDVRIHNPEGKWQADDGYGNDPAVEVTWYGARSYCAWAGKRLPTEAEWEKAARGINGRKYPWGSSPPGCSIVQYEACSNGTIAVGSRSAGASPYSALNMAGNVWEWVADWYDSAYYGRSPSSNPQGPSSGDRRVLRGGSWGTNQDDIRAANRYNYDPTDTYSDVGFRCARDAP